MATTKIVIAGCRNYHNYDEAKTYLDDCLADIKSKNDIIILSGGANGADKLGERYALEKNFRVELFLPEWDRYGKSAGPKRNELMAQACDYVICFWDGESSGTRSMIAYAKEYNKPLFIKMLSIDYYHK